MTSKERVLAAIKRDPVDYVPCSPDFNPLRPQQRVERREAGQVDHLVIIN